MDEAYLSDIRCFKFLDEHGTKKQNNKVTQQNITTLFYSLPNKYRQHAYADLSKFHNQKQTKKQTNTQKQAENQLKNLMDYCFQRDI